MSRSVLTTVARWMPLVAMAAVLHLVSASPALASCGDYLEHGSFAQPDAHLSYALSGLPLPTKSKPCRGIHCTRGQPFAPAPAVPNAHRDEHWGLFSATLGIVAESEERLFCGSTEVRSVNRTFRIDRPPCIS